MVILKIVKKSLLRRKHKALIALAAMSISVCLVLLLVHLKSGLSHTLSTVKNQADLIVAAPAQPIHLALYGLFRIGNPPPAINVNLLDELQSHPEIASIIPLSLQESHQGYAVTGSNESLFKNINSDLSQVFAEGEGFTNPQSIVLGASFAESSGYLIGERMTIAAGLEPSLSDEYPQPFTITGILAPIGSALDDSIIVQLTTLQSFRKETRENQTENTDINLALIKLHNRQALLPMQNQIREITNQTVEVIIPDQELSILQQTGNRLMNLMLGIVSITVIMALITIFFSVSGSLAERRYEIDILRMLGAKTYQVVAIGLLEPLIIILTASLSGFLLFMIAVSIFQVSLPTEWKAWIGGHEISMNDAATLLLLLLCGAVLTCIPAWMTYGQCTQKSNASTIK